MQTQNCFSLLPRRLVWFQNNENVHTQKVEKKEVSDLGGSDGKQQSLQGEVAKAQEKALVAKDRNEQLADKYGVNLSEIRDNFNSTSVVEGSLRVDGKNIPKGVVPGSLAEKAILRAIQPIEGAISPGMGVIVNGKQFGKNAIIE